MKTHNEMAETIYKSLESRGLCAHSCTKATLRQLREMGIEGVQMPPHRMARNPVKRGDIAAAEHSMCLCAVCSEGGHGFPCLRSPEEQAGIRRAARAERRRARAVTA